MLGFLVGREVERVEKRAAAVRPVGDLDAEAERAAGGARGRRNRRPVVGAKGCTGSAGSAELSRLSRPDHYVQCGFRDSTMPAKAAEGRCLGGLYVAQARLKAHIGSGVP